MPEILNEIEARVLGSLVEKQLTTPEYYPMTLNALVNACNQKNNREPVVHYDEPTVSQCLEALRDRNLVYVFYGSTSRVPKYKHMLPTVYELEPSETAVMDVMLLRGPQTLGELRTRCERLYSFSGLGACSWWRSIAKRSTGSSDVMIRWSQSCRSSLVRKRLGSPTCFPARSTSKPSRPPRPPVRHAAEPTTSGLKNSRKRSLLSGSRLTL